MEESFGKGHFLKSNADIFDGSHKHIHDLDIQAELRLASELEQSSKEIENGQNTRELGMRRMMDPVMFSYGKGKLPGLVSNPNIILDVIPADIVINSTLAKHGCKGSIPNDQNSSDYHVYQIASSAANPLTLQHLFDIAYQYFCLNPCFDKMGNPIQISVFKFFSTIEDLIELFTNRAEPSFDRTVPSFNFFLTSLAELSYRTKIVFELELVN
ncbi:hypothetical protein AgCh_002494 [Apium graveolens]